MAFFQKPRSPIIFPQPVNLEEERARSSERDRQRLIASKSAGRSSTILGGEEQLLDLSREGGILSRPTKTTLGG